MSSAPPAPPAPPEGAHAPPRPATGAGAYLLVVLALLLPGLLLQAVEPLTGLVWTELFVFLLPALALVRGSNLDPGLFLGLRRPRGRVLASAALVGLGGFLAGSAVMLAWQRVLPRSWIEAHDLSRLFEGSLAWRVAIAAAASLLAPVCEELAFRGYLQTTLRIRRGPGLAIAISTGCFAALHLDPVRFPALLVLGALFGWMAWRANSVWVAVVGHAVNNGLATVIAFTVGAAAEGAAAEPTGADAAGALGFGAAALALVVLVFRAATPAPPPASVRIAPVDPGSADLGFRFRRIPRPLARALASGLVFALAVVAVALAAAASTALRR